MQQQIQRSRGPRSPLACQYLVLTAPRATCGPLSVLWHLIPFLVSVLSTACGSSPRTFADVEAGQVWMVPDEVTALRSLLASAGLAPRQLGVEGELASTTGNWLELDEEGRIWSLGLAEVPELDSLEPLAALERLSRVRIRGASLDSLEGLGSADQLTFLSIEDSGLRQLDGLDGCRALRVLDLRGNALTTTEGLAELPALHSLDLAGNRLETLTGLAWRERLESLYLQDNALVDVAGLAHLPRLERLHLSRNALSSLDGLRDLPALRELLVDGNRLTDASAVDQLPSLEIVGLGGNRLETFPALVDRLPQHLWQDNPGTLRYRSSDP
ncbi:MAG: leucine-rich repeat domain-containing protein [Acidobacteriota bacterium]